MIYMGIDPGKNGGIAFIAEKANVEILTRENLQSIIELLLLSYEQKEIFCAVEKVGAMPGQGVVSMFNFGQGYGYIQGVLETLKIPYELVPPQKWKKEFSITRDKNKSIEVAKRLFPGVNLKASIKSKKDHDGMAEALLMAEYARRHFRE